MNPIEKVAGITKGMSAPVCYMNSHPHSSLLIWPPLGMDAKIVLIFTFFKDESKDEAQADVEVCTTGVPVAATRHPTTSGVDEPAAATVHTTGGQ